MTLCPVILLADRTLSHVDAIASQLEAGLSDCVEFMSEPEHSLADATLAIAIGGDGTLINHGRTLSRRGVPLVGVNSGRLGFLAKFDVDSIIAHRKSIFDTATATPTMDVILLEVTIDSQPPAIAMNEAMIAAGSPFRILEMGVSINGITAPTLRGDGMIISTPIGSTAHSASVGGPIVDPSSKAYVLTPIAAYSLAVRPIVLDAHNSVTVELLQANEGTSLVIDGTVHCTLRKGMKMHVRQAEHSLSIVLNPSITYWNTLVDKLHWAAPPG